MKQATILPNSYSGTITPVALEDFSRFKEKVIMINTLKSLITETDKATLKAIVRETDADMTVKTLRRALERIVDEAIKRVTT